jgi:aspartate/methionine/tyrosine aminotransferase
MFAKTPSDPSLAAKPAGPFDEFNLMLAQQPHLINLGEGIPNFPPEEFFAATLNHMKDEPLDEPLESVALRLHSKIAENIGSLWEVSIDPSHVMVGNGADDVFASFMQGYLQPGDHILTFEPNYMYYYDIVNSMQLKVGVGYPVPLR